MYNKHAWETLSQHNNLAVEKKAGHIKKPNKKKKSNKVMFNSFDQSCFVDSKSLANNLVLVLTQILLRIQMEYNIFPFSYQSKYIELFIKNQFHV